MRMESVRDCEEGSWICLIKPHLPRALAGLIEFRINRSLTVGFIGRTILFSAEVLTILNVRRSTTTRRVLRW
jgi:hypothetical protein